LNGFGCALSRVLALATANGDFLGPPFAFGPGFVRADVVRIERIVAECLEKLRNRIERGILPLRGLRRRFAGRRSRWLSSKISSLCRKRFNELIS